jgi:predicted DNA-binding WGR domain protein
VKAAPVSVKTAKIEEAPSAAPTGGTRRFEFRDGSSAKFWEVSQSAGDVTVRFARIGTSGQSQTKSFVDPVTAKKHADKLVAEKTAKGHLAAP